MFLLFYLLKLEKEKWFFMINDFYVNQQLATFL